MSDIGQQNNGVKNKAGVIPNSLFDWKDTIKFA